MRHFSFFAAALLWLLSALAFAAPQTPEAEVLNRYLGVWDDTTDPNGRVVTHCEWILDGSFLRHTWTLETADGNSVPIGLSLMSYDAVEKTYRGWTFYPNGVAVNGPASWDERSRTFTWIVHWPAGDLTTTTRATFTAPDQEIVDSTTTDATGKVVEKSHRKKVRRTDPDPSKKTASVSSH